MTHDQALERIQEWLDQGPGAPMPDDLRAAVEKDQGLQSLVDELVEIDQMLTEASWEADIDIPENLHAGIIDCLPPEKATSSKRQSWIALAAAAAIVVLYIGISNWTNPPTPIPSEDPASEIRLDLPTISLSETMQAQEAKVREKREKVMQSATNLFEGTRRLLPDLPEEDSTFNESDPT